MTKKLEVRTPNNDYLFNLFKGENGLYYRSGLVGSERVNAKDLGYSKLQLDKLWLVGLPIIDLSLV